MQCASVGKSFLAFEILLDCRVASLECEAAAMAAMVVASSTTVVGMSAVGRRDGCPCSSSSTARLPHQVLVTSRRNLVRDDLLS